MTTENTTPDAESWEEQQTDAKLELLAQHGNEPGKSRAAAELARRQADAVIALRDAPEHDLIDIAETSTGYLQSIALAEMDRRALAETVDGPDPLGTEPVAQAEPLEPTVDQLERARQAVDRVDVPLDEQTREAIVNATAELTAAAEAGPAPEVVDAGEGPQEPGTEVVPAVTEATNHATGEVIALADASPQDLVGAHVSMKGLAEQIKTEQGHVADELLRRMDSATEWTMRETVEGAPYKVSAPSPDASTEYWHADELVTVLRDLVAAGTVTKDAAAGAMKRTITLTFDVPLDADPGRLAATIGKDEPEYIFADTVVKLVKAEGSSSAHKPGITKLRKVKAAKAAIADVTNDQQPDRRVTFKKED